MSELSEGLQQLEVDRLWHQGLSGQGVRVGHIDSGVQAEHPALSGRITAFKQFDRRGAPVEGAAPCDSGEHGTHTAGLICGGSLQGVSIGAAPGAELVCAQVIDGGSVVARLVRGISWTLEQGVRVLSLPLGMPVYNPILSELLELARRRGVLPVAAVGNRGAGRSHSPGNYRQVLSVGACRADGRAASFSGSLNIPGSLSCLKPDLLAPGTQALSAHPGGGLREQDGTSMSSAYLAGAAALLFQARPDATPDQVESALLRSARPLPADQVHRTRQGVVNLPAALETLLEPGPEGFVPPEIPERLFRSSLGMADSPFVDPYLRKLLSYSGETQRLGALVQTLPQPESLESEPEVFSTARAHCGESPHELIRIPGTQLWLVGASCRYLSAMLESGELAAASSVDVDIGSFC